MPNSCLHSQLDERCPFVNDLKPILHHMSKKRENSLLEMLFSKAELPQEGILFRT